MHPIIPLQGQFEGVNNDFKVGCFRRVLTQILGRVLKQVPAGFSDAAAPRYAQ